MYNPGLESLFMSGVNSSSNPNAFMPTASAYAPVPTAVKPPRPMNPQLYAQAAYGAVPGMSPTVFMGQKIYDAGKKYLNASTLGKAKMAGGIGAKGLGLAGKALKVLGPVNAAVSAVGAVGNLGNRLMKGENIVSALGNTVYDTADYNAFGLLKPAVNAVGSMINGPSKADSINSAQEKFMKAQASGDLGASFVAQQELSELMNTTGSAQQPDLGSPLAYNQQLTADRANRALMDYSNPNNPLGAFQNAAETRRRQQAKYDNEMMRNNAKFALDQSYLADNYKSGLALGANAFAAQQQQILARQSGIQQAAMMRY